MAFCQSTSITNVRIQLQAEIAVTPPESLTELVLPKFGVISVTKGFAKYKKKHLPKYNHTLVGSELIRVHNFTELIFPL